jgi:hypothetical protein
MVMWYCGLLTISVMVSVTAQKYGGLSDQPMGRVSGMAMRGSVYGATSEGIVTARLRAVVGEIGTR